MKNIAEIEIYHREILKKVLTNIPKMSIIYIVAGAIAPVAYARVAELADAHV